jgi:DNA-directed RNA polymerase specialized sigma24 family protein
MHADTAAMERMSREEFAAFYQRTAPALRGYLSRIAANRDLADDLLQEAYIRLIHAAPAGEAPRRAYLYRTATNLTVDHFRAARRERIGLQFWKRWQPVAVARRDPPAGVERVFQLLNVRERALLWLAYVEEAAHAEIAAALGCGERSVRVLLFRARRKMERLLREHNIDTGVRK